jgi:hypothetical protein
MGVATFAQNNYTIDDSTTYKTKLDGNVQVMARIAAMFAPHQSSPAAMTVTIDAGALFVSGAIVAQSAQVSGAITAPVSNPRIDRAVIDTTTGALSIIPGAEAGSPSPPVITANKLPVAQIALVVGQVSILNANITDERIGSGAGSSSGKVVQIIDAILTSSGSTNVVVPYDNTIPQAAEMTEILTGTITPWNAANILRVDVIMPMMDTTTGQVGIMALFIPAASNNALSIASLGPAAANYTGGMALRYAIAAGGTSPITFSLRVAVSDSGYFYWNRRGAGDLFNTTSRTYMTIAEVTP